MSQSPTWEESGSVTLQSVPYTDPKFYCTNIYDPINDVYCMRITLTTESDLQLDYTQTAGYVDNATILASITELSGFTMIEYPIPPNS